MPGMKVPAMPSIYEYVVAVDIRRRRQHAARSLVAHTSVGAEEVVVLGVNLLELDAELFVEPLAVLGRLRARFLRRVVVDPPVVHVDRQRHVGIAGLVLVL
eukprot:155490-Prymnesium_polylepis.1